MKCLAEGARAQSLQPDKRLTGKHVAVYIFADQALNELFSDPVFNRIIADMTGVEIRGALMKKLLAIAA